MNNECQKLHLNYYDMCPRTEVTTQFLKSLNHSLMNVQIDDLIYEPMKGGGSAATLYRLDLHKHSYVLRLFPSHSQPLTRMHQIMLAKQAGGMGFGPKIHFVDSHMNGIIMEFIPGRNVEESDFEDADLAPFLGPSENRKTQATQEVSFSFS